MGRFETRTLAGRRRVNVGVHGELNTPVQGTGADRLKRGAGLLWERRSACPDALPVLLVHDEIVVECDEACQDEAAVWVRDAMRGGMAPLVDPVPVEVEVSARSDLGWVAAPFRPRSPLRPGWSSGPVGPLWA